MTANDTNSPPSSTAPNRALEKRVRNIRKPTGAEARPTKLAQSTKLLARARGATMAELGAATGWQPHSVRAMLSGLRKKGFILAKETRKSGDGCYRIAPVATVAATPEPAGFAAWSDGAMSALVLAATKDA
jgi:hypothetical protein